VLQTSPSVPLLRSSPLYRNLPFLQLPPPSTHRRSHVDRLRQPMRPYRSHPLPLRPQTRTPLKPSSTFSPRTADLEFKNCMPLNTPLPPFGLYGPQHL
jgi:hypothetical protein